MLRMYTVVLVVMGMWMSLVRYTYAQEVAPPVAAATAEAGDASAATSLTEVQKTQASGSDRKSLKKPEARKSKGRYRSDGSSGWCPRCWSPSTKTKVVQSQQIIEVLGRIGNKSAMPRLGEILKCRNEWLRCASVYAIGNIGGQEATPLLAECLKDASKVCEITIKTLSNLNDARAIPALIEVLRHPSTEVTEAAAQALVKLCDGTVDYGTDWMSWQSCGMSPVRNSLLLLLRTATQSEPVRTQVAAGAVRTIGPCTFR